MTRIEAIELYKRQRDAEREMAQRAEAVLVKKRVEELKLRTERCVELLNTVQTALANGITLDVRYTCGNYQCPVFTSKMADWLSFSLSGIDCRAQFEGSGGYLSFNKAGWSIDERCTSDELAEACRQFDAMEKCIYSHIDRIVGYSA